MTPDRSNIMNDYTLTLASIAEMDTADVKSYVTGARTAVKNAAKSERNATDRAAYATYLAEHVQGVIGKDGKDNPGWMTDADYAASFDRVKSIVGGWRTLGHVLVTLGLDRDSDLYMRLRNSNMYGVKAVKDVIWEATPENIVENLTTALEPLVDQYGKRIPKARAARPDDGDKGDDKGGKSLVETLEGDAKSKALLLIAALADVVGDLEVDDWVAVDEVIEGLRTRENDRHAAAVRIAG